LKELGAPELDAQIDRGRPLQELSEAVRSSTLEVLLCPSDSGPPVFPLFGEIGAHSQYAQLSTRVIVTLPRASYVGVFGTTNPDDAPGDSGSGPFIMGRAFRFDELTRGLQHVVLVGERTTRKLASTWLGIAADGEDAPGRIVGYNDIGPNRDDADECEFDSRHPGHVNFVWADGHVDGVPNDVDRIVYLEIAQRQ
jgi:prepilin-type processing-associated H-X9-DG protein